MKIGRFTIEQLSEGQFEIFKDGKFHKLTADEADDLSLSMEISMQSSKTIGIDPILVSDGENEIMLDTGLGWGLDHGSGYKNVSNVKTNLEIFNRTPEDITHVILTHLHYDHSAGSSFTDAEAATKPTFPNAKYYLQKKEWKYALSQFNEIDGMPGPGYRLDDLYRLFADDRIILLEKDFNEIIPGIALLWTGGHTPGHQVVRVYDDEKSAYYLGDLLPSEKHLNRYAMRHADVNPLQAKKMKIQLMKKIFEESAFLLFYHSLFSKAGRLIKDERKKYVLKEL